MPKISPIKGHNDSSFQAQIIPTRNFQRVREQAPVPIIRTKPIPLNDSIVPIYQVGYDPEFSKSPLASVQISRKDKPSKYMPILPELEEQVEERSHVVKRQNFQSEQQKCDWKTILCWLGISLAVITFIVGLYFFIDVILGKNGPKGQNEPSNSVVAYTNGKEPIQVNPIPYDRISPSPPQNSVSPAPITRPQQTYTSGTTYPSVLPNSYNFRVNSTQQLPQTKPEVQKIEIAPNPKPLSQGQYPINPLENSIEPLNVYEKIAS